ncbi:MAG: extracellular solute-binding protein [Candidatus Omnitrophica bacterium]|nr:extracellular solute-binding protein [Candidatus Omnitrophota bacterium]
MRVSLIIFVTFSFLTLGLLGCGGDIERNADVLVWHWMTDREDAFQELADRYNKETGIKVSFELYAPSDAYTQKVRASAQTTTLPDIYGLLAEKRDFAAFVKAGHIADLTGYMKDKNGRWESVFFKKALEVNLFLPDNQWGVEPGIYGVPIDVTNIQMLYNKTLFKKAGLDPEDPPDNWEEFLEAIRALNEAGIPGLVSGWGEIWMIDCFASNYAMNIMGKDKVIATIRGEVPYTDPDWIRLFGLFKEMADEEVLAPGVVTMVNKTAEQTFANGRAAFAFNGSWCVNVYKGMNPNLDYAAILPPRASAKNPMIIWGGAGGSFLVNENSKKKEMAVNFLKWLTAKPQQVFLAEETSNLPSNKHSLVNIPPILRQFADDMDKTTHPDVLPVNEYSQVIEFFNKGIQSIIIGEETPEDIAKKVQEIKERRLAWTKRREKMRREAR